MLEFESKQWSQNSEDTNEPVMPRAPPSCSPKVFLCPDDAALQGDPSPGTGPGTSLSWCPAVHPFSPLNISLPSPALQNLCSTMNPYSEFSMSVSLADDGNFTWNWHQYPPLGADTSDQLCHWSQPLKCPDSFHPLSHPLVKSTSHQMWETLPKARETAHIVLPLSAQHSSH